MKSFGEYLFEADSEDYLGSKTAKDELAGQIRLIREYLKGRYFDKESKEKLPGGLVVYKFYNMFVEMIVKVNPLGYITEIAYHPFMRFSPAKDNFLLYSLDRGPVSVQDIRKKIMDGSVTKEDMKKEYVHQMKVIMAHVKGHMKEINP